MYPEINISNENDFFFVINWYTNESTIKKNSKFLIGPHEKNGLLPIGILNQNSQNLKQKFVNQTYWVSNCSVSFFSICSVLENIMIRTVSFCSVSFLFVSYRFKYKLLAIHYVPFRSVSFPRSQTVCSSSTRCLYVCLLFRITVNNAELGISARTSPKTIRSQKILLHHNMSIQSKRD